MTTPSHYTVDARTERRKSWMAVAGGPFDSESQRQANQGHRAESEPQQQFTEAPPAPARARDAEPAGRLGLVTLGQAAPAVLA